MGDSFTSGAQLFGRALFGAIFGLRVEGLANVPRTGPLLVACNHISDFDPPVLGSAIPRTLHFMAKRELFRYRLCSSLLVRLGAFPVDRAGFDRTAISTALDLLSAGNAVAVFPEGTRSGDGRMLPPKPGLGFLAIHARAGILPVHISGTDSPLSAFLRRRRFRVRFGQVMPGGQHHSGIAGREEYESVTSLVMESISGLADGVGSEPVPRKEG